MLLVYSDLFRRKSLLVMFVAWPYLTTAFMLIFGYAVGSPRVFTERVGVDPIQFMIVGSYLLFSIMTIVDDIMWRPIYDEQLGTLPYIVSSPTRLITHYLSMPVPRFVASTVLGATAVFPVMVFSRGLEGLLVGLAVVLLSLISATVFTPLATAIGLSLYTLGGESWRAINVIRPLLLIVTGIYYPRWLMQWPLYLVSSLMPPAHCVEVIQRIVVGLAETYTILVSLTLAVLLGVLYSPAMARSATAWEKKKLRVGVKT
jgi:ABC-2 type transport system permease protein